MIHQKASQDEIILFTRFPEPGKAKTRLIPKLGAAGAADLQQKMAEQAVSTAMETVLNLHCNFAVYFTGGSLPQMQQWFGSEISYHEQKGADLGKRLSNAVIDSRQRGMQRIVLIGADCPELTSQIICTAFDTLQENKLVLGPSTDGGYYLIGIQYELPGEVVTHLFTKISWGTSAVLQNTLARANERHVSFSLLKELRDIDTPHDLEYFDYHSNP